MGKYSKEFKEELKLSDEIGMKNAANQLGIDHFPVRFCLLQSYTSNPPGLLPVLYREWAAAQRQSAA